MKDNNKGKIEEFKVNKFLSLTFRDKETYIRVNNVVVNICKYLLINIYPDEMEKYENVDSIDEISDLLDKSIEEGGINIPEESIFWGHCSNLQAWYDHDYDTRLLHKNLAFPLLKRLARAGDPKAKRAFKEEVALRFSSGHLPVVQFLFDGGYLNNFTKEERESLFISSKIVDILLIAIFKKGESPYRAIASELLDRLVKTHEYFISRKICDYGIKTQSQNSPQRTLT